jgi:hypothetical protein
MKRTPLLSVLCLLIVSSKFLRSFLFILWNLCSPHYLDPDPWLVHFNKLYTTIWLYNDAIRYDSWTAFKTPQRIPKNARIFYFQV